MAPNHFKCSLHCISISSLACRRTARDAEESQLTLSISTKSVLSFSLSWFVQYSAFHTYFCNNHLMKNHAMFYFRSCNTLHNVYLALSHLRTQVLDLHSELTELVWDFFGEDDTYWIESEMILSKIKRYKVFMFFSNH